MNEPWLQAPIRRHQTSSNISNHYSPWKHVRCAPDRCSQLIPRIARFWITSLRSDVFRPRLVSVGNSVGVPPGVEEMVQDFVHADAMFDLRENKRTVSSHPA